MAMMLKRGMGALAVVGAVVGGCAGKSLVVADAASPPVDTDSLPAPDRAKICVVRPSNTEGTTAHSVRDNGALVGATRGASHFCYLAEPGEHVIRIEAGGGTEQITLQAKGGRIFFLHEEVTEIMATVVAKLAWLDEPEGKSLLAPTKYVVIVSTPNDEQPKAVAPRK